MRLSEILSPTHTRSQMYAENKKRTFEIISKMAAEEIPNTSPQSVLEALTNRERLGSTALGYGIAMPHARISNISKPLAILLSLSQPILYDEQYKQSVDVILALLLPLDQNEQCLLCMAEITKLLRRKSFRHHIRKAKTDSELYRLVTGTTK